MRLDRLLNSMSDMTPSAEKDLCTLPFIKMGVDAVASTSSQLFYRCMRNGDLIKDAMSGKLLIVDMVIDTPLNDILVRYLMELQQHGYSRHPDRLILELLAAVVSYGEDCLRKNDIVGACRVQSEWRKIGAVCEEVWVNIAA
jgi:hypothetical protein